MSRTSDIPPEDIRYQNVPLGIPHSLVDACWEFTDTVYWTTEDMTQVGSLVFNARLYDDPEVWQRRLTEAKARLELVNQSIADLSQKLAEIEKQAPK